MTMRFGSKAGIFTTILAALFALLLIAAAPAFAGGQSNDSGYTEDNDTNDGNTPNNQADEGDNKHPSGKDRSVENGGSGNQGKSGSDPDGDSNGGEDKPNGSGGNDKADQDGNNGCGNDDDFEDDNNGNCGGKDKVRGSRTDCPATSTMAGKSGKSKKAKKAKKNDHATVCGSTTTRNPDCDELAAMPNSTVECDEVKGNTTVNELDSDDGDVAGGTVGGSIADVNDDVLGTMFNRGATAGKAVDRGAPATQGRLLPFTGAALLGLVALAIGLIGSGLMFWRRTHH